MIGLGVPDTRVVLIGTGTHEEGSGLPQVSAVPSTLIDLGQALVQRCGLDEDGLRIVLDPASPSVMGTALAEAAEQATGVLLVYFVGHGLLGPGGELYLATRSTDSRPSRLAHTATAYTAVRNSLLEARARATVVMLDCCFSGRAVRILGSAADAATELTEIRGAYVLTSAADNQLALAPDGEPHTAFTGELIRLLWEGDPAAPGQLTLDHAYRHLRRVLPARGCPKPRCLAADRAGELILASNPAYRPGDQATDDDHREIGGGIDAGSLDVCPYPGMAAFSAAEAQWFFGRERLVEELIGRLVDQLASGRPLVVVGPSGAGKSSLLRAGLLPALAGGALPVAGSRSWPRLLLTPTEHPVHQLATTVASLSVGANPEDLTSAVEDDPQAFADAVRAVLRGRADGHADTGARVIMVLDQFEEAFTQCADEHERGIFLDALQAVCTPAENGGESPAMLVIGLRADFYSRSAAYPWLRSALQDNQMFVGPLDGDQTRASIEKPARAVGLRLQPGLVDLLVRDLDIGLHADTVTYEPGMLPLLAHALQATWHKRRQHTMTIAGYQATHGIQHAIATTAEHAYDKLDPIGQHTARQLLLRMIRIGEGIDSTRRRVDRARLLSEFPDPAATERVLDALARARLVTLDEGIVQITHEALLRAWPRLRDWIDSDRAGLVIRQQLTDAAEAWDHDNRDPDTLYRGPRLAAARDWVDTAGRRADLTPLARDFFDASIRRELEEHQVVRRRARRMRRLVAVLSALLLLAVAATVYAVQAERTATQQRNEALSRKVAAETAAIRTANPALAAQLGLAAYRLAPTAEARGSLLSTFATPYATRLTGHTDFVRSPAFRSDGHILATAGEDRTARLWDVSKPHNPKPLVTITDHTDAVYAVAFSPDGHTLATAGADRTIRLWDVSEPEHPKPLVTLTDHADGVRSVAFSPDGRILASAGADRAARLWDVSDPRRPAAVATLTDHTDRLRWVAFSPDGSTLVTTSWDRTARLWDVSDPRRPAAVATLADHIDRLYTAAFSPDGRTLVTTSWDRTARLWDVTDPRQPKTLTTLNHINHVFSAVFSPDGHALVTTGADGTAQLWDVTDPRLPKALTTLNHTDLVFSSAFSPDGYTLVTTSADGTVRLWDVTDPNHPKTLLYHTGDVIMVQFSPDGRTLATTDADGTARLWDVGDLHHPQTLSTLTGHTGFVLNTAFSPDGRTLVTTGGDRTARLWDVTDPRHPRELSTLTQAEGVNGAWFNPDGTAIYIISDDRTVQAWDISDPHHPKSLLTLTDHIGGVDEMAISSGRRTIAAADGRSVRLWEISDPHHPESLGTLTDGTNLIISMRFSPDDRTLVTASWDHTAQLWDITDLQHPKAMATLIGHTGAVFGLAISSDSHTLATTSADGTVRLWDISNPHHPTHTATLTGHTEAIYWATFSPNDHTIATASVDNTARLWETDAERIATRVCNIANPTITPTEWNQYFPGLQYHPPCKQ